MIRHWILVGLLTITSGCTISGGIIDVDPEREEVKRISTRATQVEQTPDLVIAGNVRGVKIEVSKTGVVQQDDDVSQQEWWVVGINSNPTGKCVAVRWKLMDFVYETYEPTIVYIPGNTTKFLGVMRQEVWDFDGTKVTLPPSGHIDYMHVDDPVKNAKRGEECLFIEENVKSE